MLNLEKYLLSTPEVHCVRAATIIAMSESVEDEKGLIAFYQKHGCKCVATMITGADNKALREATGNVVGACLNSNIIERKKEHIHPLGHAIQEAIVGTRLDSSLGQNCRIKVAIVRRGNRLAVSMYGDLGFHEMSSHKTIGCGYQILG